MYIHSLLFLLRNHLKICHFSKSYPYLQLLSTNHYGLFPPNFVWALHHQSYCLLYYLKIETKTFYFYPQNEVITIFYDYDC